LKALDLTLAELPGIIDAIPSSVFQNASETSFGGR
jgi:hypothetical protein